MMKEQYIIVIIIVIINSIYALYTITNFFLVYPNG